MFFFLLKKHESTINPMEYKILGFIRAKIQAHMQMITCTIRAGQVCLFVNSYACFSFPSR